VGARRAELERNDPKIAYGVRHLVHEAEAMVLAIERILAPDREAERIAAKLERMRKTDP
jgi:hypothetical protein